MVNLETMSVEVQNHMHDSVTQDFDRVSDFNDNGLTPLQGQQDEQPEGVYRAENAIDNDVVDITTLYPLWSTDTNDRCDNNQVASDRNRQEIQDELYKDTPVKTENNKPYIDNIDAYNRDRDLITKSLSDRLGLGQNIISGDGDTENTATGETSMIDIPSPIHYGRKTTDPSRVKTSKRCTPIMVEPSEPSICDPPPDEIATATVSGHAFDPTDVCMYEYLIQGAPNPLDLEGIEEDQLLEIQQNIQDKLKQRDEERERNLQRE